MGLRKFQGKFYIYIQMQSSPSFEQPQHSEVIKQQAIKRKERCLGASPGGAGEAGELWAELGAILPPQGVLGPTGQDAS